MPGEDLVLQASPAQAAALARGVLLDDWLGPEAQQEINTESLRALSRWRAASDRALTVDGTPLSWLYEGELFADVFFREQRVADGVTAAFEDTRPERVSLRRVDPELASALRELLAGMNVSASLTEPGRPPAYPITFAQSVRSTRGLAELRKTFGVPRTSPGPGPDEALLASHAALGGLWSSAGRCPSSILSIAPRVGAGSLAAIARRGGWIGASRAPPTPALARPGSRALLAGLDPPESDPLGLALGCAARRVAHRAPGGRAPAMVHRRCAAHSAPAFAGA